MYKKKMVLCVIPARGGSKGLPGKNIKPLLGKPLIAYTIEQARASRYIDRTIVSTESTEIERVANDYGAEVPFLRPARLARDSSGTIDVMLHASEWMTKQDSYNFDIIVLLHVTTPLRSSDDIDGCIELLVDKKSDSVFSVTEAHRNPYFNMVEIVEDGTVRLVKPGKFTTRQSAPVVYDMNSSIYVWWRETLQIGKRTLQRKSHIYVMPKERSIDIDDAVDFDIAEMLLNKRISRVEKY